MPFPEQTPRIFNWFTVENLSPNQFGVYGLFRAGTWIYIGSGDIRKRLLDHLDGDNPCITKERPTHWMDVVTASMDEREKELILEFNPICNQRVG